MMKKNKLFNIMLFFIFGLFIGIFAIHLFHHYIKDMRFNEITSKGFKIEDVLLEYKYRCPYCNYTGQLPIREIRAYKTYEIHFIVFKCYNCKKEIVISPMALDNQTVDYSKFNK